MGIISRFLFFRDIGDESELFFVNKSLLLQVIIFIKCLPFGFPIIELILFLFVYSSNILICFVCVLLPSVIEG